MLSMVCCGMLVLLMSFLRLPKSSSFVRWWLNLKVSQVSLAFVFSILPFVLLYEKSRPCVKQELVQVSACLRCLCLYNYYSKKDAFCQDVHVTLKIQKHSQVSQKHYNTRKNHVNRSKLTESFETLLKKVLFECIIQIRDFITR